MSPATGEKDRDASGTLDKGPEADYNEPIGPNSDKRTMRMGLPATSKGAWRSWSAANAEPVKKIAIQLRNVLSVPGNNA
jgi:hypothetical protein